MFPCGGEFGPYVIERPLGSGAMGEVYLARDTKLFDRPVAIKVLSEALSRDPRARMRFEREVAVAAKLEHPNIVVIHDRGEVESRPYFVMEYLGGGDLVDVVRDPGERGLPALVAIARQIADALGFAHAEGVVHRDVKPGNVMVVGEHAEDVVKLVDFGIVQMRRSCLDETLVRQPGTYEYMAPEQLRNEAVDARTDLFALGIVLYELVTGAHPFGDDGDARIGGRILTEPPRSLAERVVDLPEALERLVLRLLDKDPDRRPQTAGEASVALREIEGRAVPAVRIDAHSVGDVPGTVAAAARRAARDLAAWGRTRETLRPEDALEAYRKALDIDPADHRIRRRAEDLDRRVAVQGELDRMLGDAYAALDRGDVRESREAWTRAWVHHPDAREVRALERRLAPSTGRGASDGGEDGLRKAERALDLGDVVTAAAAVDAVLASRASDSVAAALRARIDVIRAAEVDYGPYREALRRAEGALEDEDFERAREGCAHARELWPDDDEWRSLDERIAARLECAVFECLADGLEAMDRAARLASDPSKRDLDEAVRAANAAGESFARVLELHPGYGDGVEASATLRSVRAHIENACRHANCEAS